LGKFLDFQIVCMQDKATFSFRPAFHYLEQFILNSALCFFNLYIFSNFLWKWIF